MAVVIIGKLIIKDNDINDLIVDDQIIEIFAFLRY